MPRAARKRCTGFFFCPEFIEGFTRLVPNLLRQPVEGLTFFLLFAIIILFRSNKGELCLAPYNPTGPYTIQGGKREGKALELLMFEDYPFLCWFLHQLNSRVRKEKNKLHQHLEWLIGQGENRPLLERKCQYCGQRPITLFSILGTEEFGYSMGLCYTCCSDPLCMEVLQDEVAGKAVMFLSPCFSNILSFHHKSDQRQFARLLRSFYGLPQRLTRQCAFEFFSKA